MLAMVAKWSHKPKVVGSSPTPATNNINVMEVVYAETMRDLVRRANSLGIKKDNIVTIIKDGGQFMLVYFS